MKPISATKENKLELRGSALPNHLSL